MATRFFVEMPGVGIVGSDNGYDSLEGAIRAQERHPGSHVERVTNWGLSSERSEVVRSGVGSVKGTKLPRLPELLQRLTADDWRRLRALLAELGAGDEEAVSTSIGYVDLGKLPRGGLGYVGAMSNDADGRGPLEYRKAMSGAWPK